MTTENNRLPQSALNLAEDCIKTSVDSTMGVEVCRDLLAKCCIADSLQNIHLALLEANRLAAERNRIAEQAREDNIETGKNIAFNALAAGE